MFEREMTSELEKNLRHIASGKLILEKTDKKNPPESSSESENKSSPESEIKSTPETDESNNNKVKADVVEESKVKAVAEVVEGPKIVAECVVAPAKHNEDSPSPSDVIILVKVLHSH